MQFVFEQYKTVSTNVESKKEGRKEMFLFNNTLNTFYLWLYGVRHNLW